MIREVRGIMPGTLDQEDPAIAVYRFLDDDLTPEGRSPRAGLITAPYHPGGVTRNRGRLDSGYPGAANKIQDPTIGDLSEADNPSGTETRQQAGKTGGGAGIVPWLAIAATLFL